MNTPEDQLREAHAHLTDLLVPRGWVPGLSSKRFRMWEWPPSECAGVDPSPTTLWLISPGAATGPVIRVEPATTDVMAPEFNQHRYDVDDLVPACLDEIESWRA